MINYKLTVEYDGGFFNGFQIQKDPATVTVQGEIQKGLCQLTGESVKISCAGRTDAGVHAVGQTISFKMEKKVELPLMMRALNHFLQGRIVVKEAKYVEEDFHARHSALFRHYGYIVYNNKYPTALWKERCYFFPWDLDVDIMKEGKELFKGTHDFRNFAIGLKDIKSTIRSIDEAEVILSWEINHSPFKEVLSPILLQGDSFIYFYFKAPSFLHSMVRLMVSGLLLLGSKKMSLEQLKNRIDGKHDPHSYRYNIPGRGLYLLKVDYGHSPLIFSSSSL